MIKKKILYIVSTLSKSGPTFVLSNIVKFMDRDKFDVTVLTLSPEPQDTMARYFSEALGVKVETLGFSRLRGLIEATSKVSQYTEKNGIDLIHAHGLRADWVVRGLKTLQSALFITTRILTTQCYSGRYLELSWLRFICDV